MDLPNVICSLGVGADAEPDVFNVVMLAPQLLQNFKPSEFSLPHFGQNIFLSHPLKIGLGNIGAHVA